MNEIETLKQVVSNLNEAVKELQAELKALKGEKKELEEVLEPKTLEEVISLIHQNGGVWACIDTRQPKTTSPSAYIFKDREGNVITDGSIYHIPIEYRSFVLWI
jgi:predicted nuclease with TOPRIM domain